MLTKQDIDNTQSFLQRAKSKRGWCFYFIGVYLLYSIIITINELISIYQNVPNKDYFYETLFSRSMIFQTILLIIVLVSFFKLKRYFPYLLATLLIFKLCSIIRSMLTYFFVFENEYTDLNLTIQLHIIITLLMLIFVILSKQVRIIFIK